MSPKGGSEKITLANLEIDSTISQASAIFLDHHGLPLVPQPSCFKDDPLVDFFKKVPSPMIFPRVCGAV